MRPSGASKLTSLHGLHRSAGAAQAPAGARRGEAAWPRGRSRSCAGLQLQRLEHRRARDGAARSRTSTRQRRRVVVRIDEALHHLGHAAQAHHAMAGVRHHHVARLGRRAPAPRARRGAVAWRGRGRRSAAAPAPGSRAACRRPPAARRAASRCRHAGTGARASPPKSAPGASVLRARRGTSSAHTTEKCMPIATAWLLRAETPLPSVSKACTRPLRRLVDGRRQRLRQHR